MNEPTQAKQQWVMVALDMFGRELKRRKLDHKPTWIEQSRWSNKVALQYGAHPGLRIEGPKA